ncbi:MAG TPA: 3-phosphoshikimate 1-carboxyvinyltransferase [Thermoanaerobaculia bacterium]|nr:3-phosphoshikimate 1-carboxyvinyltransferase [Thermoanaerobaculia bacterium]
MSLPAPDRSWWRSLAAGESIELPDPLPIPAGRRLRGRVQPPPSKSVSHRYLTLALLAGREVRVERLLRADDLDLFLAALERCGRPVRREGSAVVVGAAASPGFGGSPTARRDQAVRLDCGNAGTMFRFLTAALTAIPGRWVLDGTPRLRQRPIAPLVDALRQLGAELRYLEVEGHAPLAIDGATLDGGECSLDASQSSQFLSALLMAGSRARRPLEIEVTALRSDPYVDVTAAGLTTFGLAAVSSGSTAPGSDRWSVRPAREDEVAGGPGTVLVEADYSAVAYPAAGAALTGGDVVIEGLDPGSAQGDRRFLELLLEMGAGVEWGESWVRVRGSRLRGVDVDLSALPDQVPTLAAVACFARGETVIRNVAHLRHKESDRLSSVTLELRETGFEVEEGPDFLRIAGGAGELPREPVVVETHDDHRIAMSLALVGLMRPGLAIAAPGVVAKSYPGFWRDLAVLVSSNSLDDSER